MAVSACSALGALVDADDLGGVRRIDGDDLAFGAEALAADDQVVFAGRGGRRRAASACSMAALLAAVVKSWNGSFLNCGSEASLGVSVRVAIALYLTPGVRGCACRLWATFLRAGAKGGEWMYDWNTDG